MLDYAARLGEGEGLSQPRQEGVVIPEASSDLPDKRLEALQHSG